MLTSRSTLVLNLRAVHMGYLIRLGQGFPLPVPSQHGDYRCVLSHPVFSECVEMEVVLMLGWQNFIT